jgi:deoxycytidylate deaminase
VLFQRISQLCLYFSWIGFKRPHGRRLTQIAAQYYPFSEDVVLSKLQRIDYPELFFGFVAPIGADLSPSLKITKELLEREGYRVIEIKVTDLFRLFTKFVPPTVPLVNAPLYERFSAYISYGNQLRKAFEDDAVLAASAVHRIVTKRNLLPKKQGSAPFEKTAYLLYQFKRKEEVELLRSIYGRLFFQISAYSRRGARVHSLATRCAGSEHVAQVEQYRGKAEELVQRDEDESGVEHGQRVGKIFHDADFILNLDISEPSLGKQISRFVEILFSSNSQSPTKIEYGMFSAKAAALRSIDLSRQVGVAIFSDRGEVISLGSNEVPKAGGGTYWSDDDQDARDYVLLHDPNEVRKKDLLLELLKILGLQGSADSLLNKPEIANSQFMAALEYGRVVHAEMSAISDAARLGRATKDAVLFTTTFPCHLCAKHIVASGISKVWFLEPYPKSLASNLHPDSLQIESSDRGKFSRYPAVEFEHFYGVTPRRYRELFERGARKDKSDEGRYQPYIRGKKIPNVDIKVPFYFELEEEILKQSLHIVREFLETEVHE